jgi:drug/metabolite transporter (DMT)-like permease
MKTALILVAVTLVTLLGDYFIKLASDKPDGLLSHTFALGLIFYGLPAIGWFFLMRSHSLAAIGVLYSASTILLLAALGVFVFKEAFGWREAVGMLLAISAVLVVGQR